MGGAGGTQTLIVVSWWPLLRNIYGGVGEQFKPYLANIIKVKLQSANGFWLVGQSCFVFFWPRCSGFYVFFPLS